MWNEDTEKSIQVQSYVRNRGTLYRKNLPKNRDRPVPFLVLEIGEHGLQI